ncbi:MFS transporter [Pedobacter sp. SYSU D00535]|uniref:MFS transporter n=1 Tax=Pedobacter sp. SYSU D00535 TaxID=2810308 RepID=UPI001A96DA78|nr:MFS transporter [Pedobacter sp. SYSU D00535]
MEKPKGKYRWKILGLLFIATAINYFDRSIIGFLGPTLRNHVFYWTDQDYANIQITFKIAYALGLIAMGALIDKVGTKIGYTISIVVWTIFGMSHALVTTAMGWVGFAIARFGLGFGEAGNFPAAIKTVAEWFPKKERAYATGLFNAGSNVGAILAPLLIPLFVDNEGLGWQNAFFITSFFSFAWIIMWWRTYNKPERHPHLSKEELDYINSDQESSSADERPVSWKLLLGRKETWAFAFAKTTDAVWLFYLFWGGFFLNRAFGLELRGLAIPIVIIYLLADAGSIAGGWFSSFLIKKGMEVYKARKAAMLASTTLIVPVIFAPQAQEAWVAVLLIALAAAGHQAWSSNLLTLVPDIFPKKATASVVGIGGMVGYATGALSDYWLGKVLTESGGIGYVYAFAIAGSLYFVALLVIHYVLGQMKPIDQQALRNAYS